MLPRLLGYPRPGNRHTQPCKSLVVFRQGRQTVLRTLKVNRKLKVPLLERTSYTSCTGRIRAEGIKHGHDIALKDGVHSIHSKSYTASISAVISAHEQCDVQFPFLSSAVRLS